MKERDILLIVAALLSIFGFFYFREISKTEEGENDGTTASKEFVECLKEEGIVVYGEPFCAACNALVESFGGREKINPIYVDCQEESDRCREEKLTGIVPEIQLEGSLFYEGYLSPEEFAQKTECDF